MHRYIKSAHENKKNPCDKCDKSFSRNEDLMAHIKKNHKIISCKMCKMSINGEKMFNIHIKLNHEARSILKIGLKSSKPINECTPDYQKLKSKKLSSALRNVTGGDKSFRKLVFNNVDLSSTTLGSLDQCIQAVHQYFNQRLIASKYKIKDKSSEIHGEKLLQLVNNFNAYNLYN